MKFVLCAAVLVVCQGQRMTDEDYFHYHDSDASPPEDLHGVSRISWNRGKMAVGITDWTLVAPSLHKFTMKQGSQLAPYTKRNYWLMGAAAYVVVKGEVKLTMNDGSTETMVHNDLFFTGPGMTHNLENDKVGEAIVMAIATWLPEDGEPPAAADDPDGEKPPSQQVLHKYDASKLGPSPLEGLTLTAYPATDIFPSVLVSKIEPRRIIPWHYHPTGAFYFFTEGHVDVTSPPLTERFAPYTARWVRPGFAYGPESSADDVSMFVVITLDPIFGNPPKTPYIIAKKETVVEVTYANNQRNLPPPAGPPGGPPRPPSAAFMGVRRNITSH